MRRRNSDGRDYRLEKKVTSFDLGETRRRATAFDFLKRQGARLWCCTTDRKADSKVRSRSHRESLPSCFRTPQDHSYYLDKQSQSHISTEQYLNSEIRSVAGEGVSEQPPGALAVGSGLGRDFDLRELTNRLRSRQEHFASLQGTAHQDRLESETKWAEFRSDLYALRPALLKDEHFVPHAGNFTGESVPVQIVRRLEVRMTECEEALRKAYSSMQRLTDEHQVPDIVNDLLALFPATTPAPERAPSPSESDTESLLDRYFDRLGDINIANERRTELEYEHQQKAAKRELRRDQDQKLKLSDAAFEAKHHARLREIEQELEAATADVARLRKECLDRGLDIEPKRRASLSESSVATDDDDMPGSSHSFSLPPQALQRDHDRLEQWVHGIDVTPDAPDLPPLSAISSCDEGARRVPSAGGRPSDAHE